MKLQNNEYSFKKELPPLYSIDDGVAPIERECSNVFARFQFQTELDVGSKMLFGSGNPICGFLVLLRWPLC